MSSLMTQDQQIAPLEFFTTDSIHPDNAKLLKEFDTFTHLGFFKRLALRRYVGQLRRDLRRRGYNDVAATAERLWTEYRDGRARWEAGERSAQLEAWLREVIADGRAAVGQLEAMREDYERYRHYSAWLEYEAANRKRLKREAKREAEIRRAMRLESKWLQQLLYDVFRKTKGCHHIYSDGKGKEYTRIPKFERAVIEPDAHWFWLSASRKVLWWYKWKLPYGVNVDNLTDEETIRNMQAATKREVRAVWSSTGQLLYRVSRLDSPDALPKMVMWRDVLDYFPTEKAPKLPYCIGVKEGRKLHWFDFASEPHALIAGKSQSGKSNLVNGIIATLVSKRTPADLRLVLIDQKGGIEFSHWKELPHLLWQVAKTTDDVQPYLERLIAVMRRRMSLLEAARAKDIEAYNKIADERLPRVLVVVDELNTFVGLGQLTEDIHNALMLIASQGRAVGMHLILCTQHPEVRVVPGRIKTNMGARLSGAMPSVSASQIILDQVDAANLPNVPGRFVAVSGMNTYIVQCPRIEDADIAQVVSRARLDFPEVPDELAEMGDAPRLRKWDETETLEACHKWLDGHLSAQKLHKLLGEESPGERHFSGMIARIIRQAEQDGGVSVGGVRLAVRKVKKGYYLKAGDSLPTAEQGGGVTAVLGDLKDGLKEVGDRPQDDPVDQAEHEHADGDRGL